MNYCPSRRVVLLCACSLPLLLALGCGPARGEWTSSRASHVPVLPEDAESWTFEAAKGRIIETDHYRVYTTVNDALLLEKLPALLETVYEHYSAFLPSEKVDEEPLEIYLFGHRSEWESYTRQNMGATADNYLKIRAGGYSHDGISVVYLLDRYSTFGVLAHEGFHQFANSRLVHRIPAWMEEGLACNFEAHFWKAGTPVFAPDLNEFRLKALQQAIRRDSLFPLSEILGMHAGHAVALSAEKTATFYAQGWALTRFLQEGRTGKYRRAFRQMLDDAADGANLYSQTRAVEIFESYFQEDIEAIAEDFVLYARFLAARQVEPGMKIYVVSPGESTVIIKITAEQIEQTKREKRLKKLIETYNPPETEEPLEPEEPAEQGPEESPEPQPPVPQEDTDSSEAQDQAGDSEPEPEKEDTLIIKIEKQQEQDNSE